MHIKTHTHRPVFWSSFFLVVLNIAEKTKLGKNNVVLKDALLLKWNDQTFLSVPGFNYGQTEKIN